MWISVETVWDRPAALAKRWVTVLVTTKREKRYRRAITQEKRGVCVFSEEPTNDCYVRVKCADVTAAINE